MSRLLALGVGRSQSHSPVGEGVVLEGAEEGTDNVSVVSRVIILVHFMFE